jgi:hypothetical protein
LYVINKKLFSIKLVLIYLDNGGVVETTIVDMVGKICWGSLEVFLLTLFCSPMLLTSGCGGTTPIMVTLFVARIKSLQQWIFKLQWIHQSWFDTNMFLRKCRWWLGGYFATGCRLKITWWDDILSLLMPACAWLVVGVSRLHNTCSSLIRFLHPCGVSSDFGLISPQLIRYCFTIIFFSLSILQAIPVFVVFSCSYFGYVVFG